MKTITLLLLLLLCPSVPTLAQDDPYVTKSFLIISSTKKYNKALSKAQKAANSLVIPLDLRGATKDPDGGLTSTQVDESGEKVGYWPRGRYDDGEYISIEFSSAFEGFTPDYYIVIVASGERSSLEELLPKVKKYFKDAYIKDTRVYMGSIHCNEQLKQLSQWTTSASIKSFGTQKPNTMWNLISTVPKV